MKKIKNNFNSFFLLLITAVVFTTTGCDNLENINIDPNNPKDVDLGLIFTRGEERILYKYGRFTNGTDWDTWSGLWVQQFAGNHGAGVNYDLYDVQAINSLWDRQYDGFKDLSEVIRRGTESKAWEHVGAAKIITALGLGTLTSVYGDMPWSEALKGSETPYPKFDTQEDIYKAMIAMVTEAIADLDKTSTSNLGNADFAYNGDVAKWKALGYALLARYENVHSKKDPSGSATRALAAVDQAKTAGFTSHGNDLTFPYSGQDIFLNGWFHMFENNQMIASDVFMNYLKTNKDPRVYTYWNDITTDGLDVGYNGKANALGTSNISFSPVGPQGFYGKKTSPQLIVTHFELLFIESEAAFRSGDMGRAATALNQAIENQIDLVTPAYTSHIGTLATPIISSADYASQIAAYKTAHAAETATSITLEKIMTQKYLAMFSMNTEIWNDLRRHDYKFPSYLAIPKKPDGTPIGSQFIQRVLYPQESTNTNANTPKSDLFTKLWIFN